MRADEITRKALLDKIDNSTFELITLCNVFKYGDTKITS